MLISVLHCKSKALCYSEELLCSFVSLITTAQQTLACFMSVETNESSFLKGTMS